MLFMGEEYGEKAPFQYFTSHSDEALIEAVRRGRLEEFDDFAWSGEPPDPHAEETFERSKLNWSRLTHDEHASLRRLYAQLLRLRRETPALRALDLDAVEAHADDERRVLLVRRGGAVLIAFNFSGKAQSLELPFAPAAWRAMMDTGSMIESNRITIPPDAFAIFRT
jgi:maltooligosyltrehalose trehalohydrolase